MLKNVPLFGIGNEGKSPNVSAQKRENLYVEFQADPESNGLALYPTPGLTTFVNFGANPSRGIYQKGDSMYVVNGGTFWEVAANGVLTSRGTLLTTGGRVDITDNGLQLLIVDGTTTGYVFTFATNGFAQVTLPGAATNCTFMNGYGVINEADSARAFYSAIYDFATWNALDFFTAESDPDDLVRPLSDNGMLILFGDKTTEFWGDSGAQDLPFARIGAAAIQWGLAARWSLARFDGTLMFLRKNQMGAVQVCKLVGTNAQVVSNEEMDWNFSQYSSVENATAYTYMVSGHPMYCISFPTENVSWEFDGKSGEWHKRSSGTASDRHRGQIQTNFLNRSYVTDYANGKVYLIDEATYTEDGDTIVREFVTRHNKAGDFIRIAQLWLEMEAGTGLNAGQGADPQVMLQISRDGGHTWGAEVWRGIGAIGKYRVRALWNALGRSRDWLFKFRVTDPVKTVFVAGWAKVV